MSIQLKRGTSAQRKNSSVVLADGQPFYEKDTKQLYIGDGSTAVKDLQSLILNAVYPVDSIYMSVNPANPSTLFGGTWIAWGSGKVPVGVSANDSDFGTVEKTGGEKKHKLTTNEMPNHRHKGIYQYSEHVVNHGQKPYDTNVPLQTMQGTREVEVQYKVVKDTATSTQYYAAGSGPTNDIYYSEKVTCNYGVADNGGDISHNNLQPYITCYMWKRTA